MCPFHPFTQLEKKIYPKSYNKKFDKIKKILLIGKIDEELNKKLENICFFNPTSPQGMLIFGALTCALRLKNI